MRYQDGYPLVLFLLITAMVILAKIFISPVEAATSAPERTPSQTMVAAQQEMDAALDSLEASINNWVASVDEFDEVVDGVFGYVQQ